MGQSLLRYLKLLRNPWPLKSHLPGEPQEVPKLQSPLPLPRSLDKPQEVPRHLNLLRKLKLKRPCPRRQQEGCLEVLKLQNLLRSSTLHLNLKQLRLHLTDEPQEVPKLLSHL